MSYIFFLSLPNPGIYLVSNSAFLALIFFSPRFTSIAGSLVGCAYPEFSDLSQFLLRMASHGVMRSTFESVRYPFF